MATELKKKYGLLTVIAMIVGVVTGSGVFFKTEAVLENGISRTVTVTRP